MAQIYTITINKNIFFINFLFVQNIFIHLHNINVILCNVKLLWLVSASENLLIFLKNTEKALRYHSVDELNEALLSVLKCKTDKKEEINFVLELVAAEYGMSRRTLVNSTSRGKIQTAKKMAQCLLHYVVGLNTRYIAARIFNRWQNSVTKSILYYRTLDLSVPTDKEFNDIYNKLEQSIINKFKHENLQS